MTLKHELQNIISGNGLVSNGEIIQTIAGYVRGKKKAISGIEKGKLNKEQETHILIDFIETKGLWYTNPDESKYVGEGAEQKIYEHADPNFVLKFNDGYFYSLWDDYIHCPLIHNCFLHVKRTGKNYAENLI